MNVYDVYVCVCGYYVYVCVCVYMPVDGCVCVYVHACGWMCVCCCVSTRLWPKTGKVYIAHSTQSTQRTPSTQEACRKDIHTTHTKHTGSMQEGHTPYPICVMLLCYASCALCVCVYE